MVVLFRGDQDRQKATENYARFTDEKMDMVRMFNLLPEGNFKKEHEVQFYATH